nr:hypothetical protein [Stenotrophomonas sepilia]
MASSTGSNTFTYNDANRMNAVKQGNAVLESYSYNHRGERVLRAPTGGAAQVTLYDEAGQSLGNFRPWAKRSSRPSGWTTTRWR